MLTHYRKTLQWTISMLALVALVLVSVVPAGAVMIGNDEINFVAVRYDYPNPGESTWYYQVISGSGPAISHVTWALNLSCVEVVDAGSWDGVSQDNLTAGGGNPGVVNPDPTTQVTGIKFDEGFNDNETRYYYFTVDGNLITDDNIVVASKGGPGFDTGYITGPSGSCVEVANPSLDLEKYVNTADADSAPGPSILEGDPVAFDFTVTNTGDVTLTDIVVTDDIFGEICTIASLVPATSQTCTYNTTAVLGDHANMGTASTIYDGEQVQDMDPAHYTGTPRFVAAPAIDIEKFVNGDDADTAPGPEVLDGSSLTFDFVVTNIGNVALTDIEVNDDVLGLICTIAILEPEAAETCTIAGVTALLGLHTNIGTATGSYEDTNVSDSDPANYTGVPKFIPNPALDLEKYVNGEDADVPTGPTVPVGSTVTFEYVVTNTGNVDLENVIVGDDVLGVICTIDLLSVGETETCAATEVAIEGQYQNTGKARTEYNGEVVHDFDDGHYFGEKPFVPTPGIDIEKYVNGMDADEKPGISLPAGSMATFTYVVTNTGNVPLTNITVADNILGIICRIAVFDPGQTTTCSKTSQVVVGPYSNVGKAATWYGNPKTDGIKVADHDWAHYTGILP